MVLFGNTNRHFWARSLIAVLFLCGTLVFSAGSQAKDEAPLVIGVFPRVNAIETNRMFQPLAQYLSEVTGHKVVLETAKDFESFWQGVTQKRYDLVHYNQYHYVKSHREQGYQAILKNVEQGQATLGAALLVRSDAEIHSIADLRGKKIVFGGDRSAMQAYVIATYLLRKGGLRKGDYMEEFAKNPPNAVMAVHFKQADAAGAGDHVLDIPSLAKNIDVGQMKYLATGEQLPHLPWAVKGDMPQKLRQKIQQAMSQLGASSEGKKILKNMNYDGFLPASDADYEQHRQIIREVLGEGY